LDPTKQFEPHQNNLYPSKTIWTFQNHFGPIDGQGINQHMVHKKPNEIMYAPSENISTQFANKRQGRSLSNLVQRVQFSLEQFKQNRVAPFLPSPITFITSFWERLISRVAVQLGPHFLC
jgi:hypothetical protein